MIYIARAEGLNALKVGFTQCAWGLFKRINSLQTACPVPLRVVAAITEGTMAQEKALHDLMTEWRMRGEWFKSNPVLEKLIAEYPVDESVVYLPSKGPVATNSYSPLSLAKLPDVPRGDIALTRAQEAVLHFVSSHITERGYPPTGREIQERFGFKSQTASIGHLKALRRKGRISWIDGQSRTVRICV